LCSLCLNGQKHDKVVLIAIYVVAATGIDTHLEVKPAGFKKSKSLQPHAIKESLADCSSAAQPPEAPANEEAASATHAVTGESELKEESAKATDAEAKSSAEFPSKRKRKISQPGLPQESNNSNRTKKKMILKVNKAFCCVNVCSFVTLNACSSCLKDR
jgi:hypothetical protein